MDKAIIDVFCYGEDDFVARNYLRGYVFSESALVLGSKGLELYKQYNKTPLWENCKFGRFLLQETVGDITIIRTDPLGQEPLYYWQAGSEWLISNSLLLISEKLKARGHEVRPYQPAIDTFKMANQTLSGGQLLSAKTVVKDVKLLALNSCFKITKSSIAKQSLLAIEILPSFTLPETYRQCLIDYCSAWVGRVEAISKLRKPVELALSGGFDSRSCLAILQNANNGSLLNFSATSHEYDEEEFIIANAACNKIGISLSKGSKAKERRNIKLPFSVSFRNSMLVHAGVKTNFGIRDKVVQTKRWHCIGGSVIGTFTMRNSFNQRSQAILQKYDDFGEKLSDEIAVSLDELDIELDNDLAMFHHYYNFRARFHYGMDLYTSQNAAQIHPLLDYQLIHAATLAGKEYTLMNGVNTDIISILRPELLEVPFDNGRILPNESLINDVCFSDLKPLYYKTFGDFDDAYEYDMSLSDMEIEKTGKAEGLSYIFETNKLQLERIALQFGFSESYFSAAAKEVSAGSKLKKAGVLLGLLYIFS